MIQAVVILLEGAIAVGIGVLIVAGVVVGILAVRTSADFNELRDDFCTVHVEICAEEGTPHAD